MITHMKLTPSNQQYFYGRYEERWTAKEVVFTLTYLKEEQDSYTCIVLTLLIDGKKFRNFRVVFMDTDGNPLDDEIRQTMKSIYEDITSIVGASRNQGMNEFVDHFATTFHNYIVHICYGRKILLLDFDNPTIWERSKDVDVSAASDEYLKQVRATRELEDSMIYLPTTRITE